MKRPKLYATIRRNCISTGSDRRASSRNPRRNGELPRSYHSGVFNSQRNTATPLDFYILLLSLLIFTIVFDKHGSSRTRKSPKIETTLQSF